MVAYGALLPPRVLEIPLHGWVNLHFSLLPAWRGASPVQAAIRAGDDVTGASTFRLEAGMDTGPVYGVLTETIRPDDTTGDLLDRLADGRRAVAARHPRRPAGRRHPGRPQPADGVSYAAKVTTADARIDWSTPAVGIDRLVRSVTPEPGAWTDSPWGRMVLGPVAPVDRTDLLPGELAVGKTEVLVGTAPTAVRLGRLTPPGRRPMAAADWARGVRPAAGTVLS